MADSHKAVRPAVGEYFALVTEFLGFATCSLGEEDNATAAL